MPELRQEEVTKIRVLWSWFGDLGLRTKLLLLLLFVGLVPFGVSGYIAFDRSGTALEKQAFNQKEMAITALHRCRAALVVSDARIASAISAIKTVSVFDAKQTI